MVLQTERYNGGYPQQSYSTYQGPTGSYNNFQGVTDYTFPYSGPFQVSTYPLNHGPNHQSGWSTSGDCYENGARANHHYPYPMVALLKPTYGSSYYERSYTYENSYPQGNSKSHGSPHHQDYENPYSQGYESPHHQSHGSPYSHAHGSPHHQSHGSPDGQGHESPHHQGHGSTHGQGHESPHQQGSGNSYGLGKTGFGGAITNQINKLTHGYKNYGSSSLNNGHNPSVLNHGNPQSQGHGNPHNQGHGSPHSLEKTHSFGGAITKHDNYGSGSPNYGHNPSGFNHGYQQPSWTLKGLDDDE
ncbi:hypothetical protein L1987_62062 [Smallanthus sonchifolius]|uniref:Uncharacterized protein n=1 Tax=Smallanthus sonchifolius TaxID=185202 RepID=A0ACB9C9C9_9ASTR|nr:hypothetical protein L1987_62062 [Smallanthus sonchifolius]